MATSRLYRNYCIFTGIVSIPLVVLIFKFDDIDGPRRWIGQWSFIAMFLLALPGAIAGFVKYVVCGDPGPIEEMRAKRKAEEERDRK